VATVEACLERLGICFCFAPQLHPSMKHVAAARRMLGVPTIFNLLGPLCNPASASCQLLGVGRPSLRALLAQALALLDAPRALVVCGADGLDEVSLSGDTEVSEVRRRVVREFRWHPADFGLELAAGDTLRVPDPAASAAIIRAILDGQRGLPRDIVILNAAAALWVAGEEADLRVCAARAAGAIDSGAARRLLAALAEASRE
jgi:anthranilate phosphoribosyltransferase